MALLGDARASSSDNLEGQTPHGSVPETQGQNLQSETGGLRRRRYLLRVEDECRNVKIRTDPQTQTPLTPPIRHIQGSGVVNYVKIPFIHSSALGLSSQDQSLPEEETLKRRKKKEQESGMALSQNAEESSETDIRDSGCFVR
ncbi:hypothetical protein E5288_WYG021246 [Bos mutus]|uniref:Uncharacterized protein n=1 Tax=Bos mutus TaxID=72004 RepID=A0A6B0SAV4_9CETA|nr:hypothetical protein [Bos mutus]